MQKFFNKLNYTLILIFVFICVFIAWSYQYKIDQVVKAEGKIIPTTEILPIQSRFSGKIQKVNIYVGDKVNKNDVLFEIDPEEDRYNLDKEISKLHSFNAKISRFNAEINDLDINFNKEIPKNYKQIEIDIYIKNKEKEKINLTKLSNKIKKLQIIINENKSSLDILSKKKKTIENEILTLKNLRANNIINNKEVIFTEKELYDLYLEINEKKFIIKKSIVDINLIKEEKLEVVIKRKFNASKKLAELVNQKKQTLYNIDEIKYKNLQRQILSPITGIVTSLKYPTQGPLAKSGEILAELIPQNSNFYFEAEILPKDIGKIKINDKALLTLVAYDFSDFGHLKGEVSNISMNSTEDKEKIYFRTLIDFSSLKFSKKEKMFIFFPGMQGEANILSQKISVFDYITKPLLKGLQKSLKEN